MVFNFHENNEKLKILMDFWSENWQQQKKIVQIFQKAQTHTKCANNFFGFQKSKSAQLGSSKTRLTLH